MHLNTLYVATLYALATLQNGPFDHFINERGHRYTDLDASLTFSDGIEAIQQNEDDTWWWKGGWAEYPTAVAPSITEIVDIFSSSDDEMLSRRCASLDNENRYAEDLADSVPVGPGSPWTRATYRRFKNAHQVLFACMLRNASSVQPRLLSFLTRPLLYSTVPTKRGGDIIADVDKYSSVVAFIDQCNVSHEYVPTEERSNEKDIERIIRSMSNGMRARKISYGHVRISEEAIRSLMYTNMDHLRCTGVDTIASTKVHMDGHVVRYDLRVYVKDIHNSTSASYSHNTVLNPSTPFYVAPTGGVGLRGKARLMYIIQSRVNGGRTVSVWHRTATNETVVALDGENVHVAAKVCADTHGLHATKTWRADSYVAHPLLPTAIVYLSPTVDMPTVLTIDFVSLCSAMDPNTSKARARAYLQSAFRCIDGSLILSPWTALGKDVLRQALGLFLYNEHNQQGFSSSQNTTLQNSIPSKPPPPQNTTSPSKPPLQNSTAPTTSKQPPQSTSTPNTTTRKPSTSKLSVERDIWDADETWDSDEWTDLYNDGTTTTTTDIGRDIGQHTPPTIDIDAEYPSVRDPSNYRLFHSSYEKLVTRIRELVRLLRQYPDESRYVSELTVLRELAKQAYALYKEHNAHVQ